MIWNARRVRFAHLQRNDYFNISRLSHSAECSKRYFHRRGCKAKEQSKSQNAVDRYDPADEKRIQKSPQTFLNPE